MPGAKHTKEMNFGYWCARIGHAFRARLETRTRQMGLSGMQAIVLSILEGLGSSTLVELARMVEHAHPSVLRHLDSLEQEGFVERTPHPRDRRVKVIRLTEKGRAAVPPVRAAMFEVQEQAAEGLDDAEVEHLLAGFRRIAMNLGCCHQGPGPPAECCHQGLGPPAECCRQGPEPSPECCHQGDEGPHSQELSP